MLEDGCDHDVTDRLEPTPIALPKYRTMTCNFSIFVLLFGNRLYAHTTENISRLKITMFFPQRVSTPRSSGTSAQARLRLHPTLPLLHVACIDPFPPACLLSHYRPHLLSLSLRLRYPYSNCATVSIHMLQAHFSSSYAHEIKERAYYKRLACGSYSLSTHDSAVSAAGPFSFFVARTPWSLESIASSRKPGFSALQNSD